MLDIENSALIDLLKTDYAPGNPGLREQLDEVAEEVERSGKPVMEIIENYGLFSRPTCFRSSRTVSVRTSGTRGPRM